MNMEIKSFIKAFILLIIFSSCEHIEYQSLEVNYIDKTFTVNSEKYVIDSIIMSFQSKDYYIISLKDKLKGTNKLNFNQPNKDYVIEIDSLNYLCNNLRKITEGDVEIFIRKKGFKEKIMKTVSYNNIQNFSYKYLPCSSERIDTLAAQRLYK